MGASTDGLGLGLTFAAEPPGLVATFSPRPSLEGRAGLLHGGVAATCLDETMARLCWELEAVPTVTATLNLRFRTGVPLDGRPVRVEAWPDGPGGRRVQRVRGRIVLEDGTVAVEAKALFVRDSR